MRRKKLSLVFAVIVILSIGYAVVTSSILMFGDVIVSTNTFDVIFVKASLNGEDITDEAIKTDKTVLEYSVDNLTNTKEESSLEFYIKNQSNQYDATATISCSAYTTDETKREENTNLFNEYIDLKTDKEEYNIKALKVESGLINIKLKKLYNGNPTSVYFRCTLIANATERDTVETKPGKIPGAYVMGMLASNFDSEPQLLNNQTGEAISYDALEELTEVVNSNQAIDSPVGNILTIMGNHAPAHYLICDGSEYNISDYPFLASYFEQEFGSKNYFGGNGTTTFKVPDLRGEFLRGSGTASRQTGSGSNVGIHQDPTQILHEIMQPMGNGFKYHRYISESNTSLFSSLNVDKYFTENDVYDVVFEKSSSKKLTSQTDTTYSSRPTNTSVLYVIKYEPTYYMVIKTK